MSSRNPSEGEMDAIAAPDGQAPVRALRPGRVALASLTVIGVDLFFNAGVLAWLFEQSREPALLPDEVLVRRIPVAYLALVVATTGLAWILDRTGRRGRQAVATGSGAGLVVGVAGLGALWTAVDLTGIFVLAGIVVTVVEGAAAALVLASPRSGRGLVVRVAAAFVALAVLGQVAANLAAG